MSKVDARQYEDAVEEEMGWCTTCHAFTREMTEPDALNNDCPLCGNDTVMGAEQALLEEEIELSMEDE